MERITFRPDSETEALIERATQETGLTPSELCRLSVTEWIGKKNSKAIIAANIARRIKSAKKARAA